MKSGLFSLIFLFSILIGFAQNNEQKYNIGDFAHGGIVFYVDDSGAHGLVCSLKYVAEKTPWDNELEFHGDALPSPKRNTKSVAVLDGLFDGKENTQRIIDFVGDSLKQYAAKVCDDYEVKTDSVLYDDWFLPSREALSLLYTNRIKLDANLREKGFDIISGKTYWSSTDVNCNEKPYKFMDNVHLAWAHNFSLGNKHKQLPSRKYMPYFVRAIRIF